MWQAAGWSGLGDIPVLERWGSTLQGTGNKRINIGSGGTAGPFSVTTEKEMALDLGGGRKNQVHGLGISDKAF